MIFRFSNIEHKGQVRRRSSSDVGRQNCQSSSTVFDNRIKELYLCLIVLRYLKSTLEVYGACGASLGNRASPTPNHR